MEKGYFFIEAANPNWVFQSGTKAMICKGDMLQLPHVPSGDEYGPITKPIFEDWVTEEFIYGHDFVQCRPAGEYHCRIWRPGNCPQELISGGTSNIRQSAQALEIITEKMLRLFRTVEPNVAHSGVYGHEIRNVLLLACMEVESSLAAILRVNNYVKKNLKTEDYVKLLSVLQLDKFSISMHAFPDYPKIIPFEGWNDKKPTQSLPWYHAYNETKHNREGNFKSAELRHAISAVAAVVCLLYSQFGPSKNYESHSWDWATQKVFRLETTSEYRLSEAYVHYSPRIEGNWTPVDVTL